MTHCYQFTTVYCLIRVALVIFNPKPADVENDPLVFWIVAYAFSMWLLSWFEKQKEEEEYWAVSYQFEVIPEGAAKLKRIVSVNSKTGVKFTIPENEDEQQRADTD